MKNILILVLLSFFLISCEKEVESEKSINSVSWTIKQDFFLDTKKYSDFSNSAELVKSWKISSNQDIVTTTQVNGRVSYIHKKEWVKVNKWDLIISIEDNIANYKLHLESAKNNLERAKLNYSSTKITLDKAIEDIEKNISNSQIDNDWSTSSLEIKKIDDSIKKLALDYDNLKITHWETINSFKKSLNKENSNLNVYLEDVIDFADELLWVTDKNKDKNDNFEDYLWRKDTQQLNITKTQLRELINFRDNIQANNNFNFEGTGLFIENIIKIENIYSKIDRLLTNLDEVLDNSISSIWSLSDTQIDWYKSGVSWLHTLYNANNSSFIANINQINPFLETYLNTEESLLKQIELLEQDRQIFISNLDYKIDRTNATLDEAKLNRTISLKNLTLSIKDAEIVYKQALKQYHKLSILSPINWIIKEIKVDVGQELWVWTPVFSIVSTGDSIIEVGFTKTELNKIHINDKVAVLFDGIRFQWIIQTISPLADNNLKYTSKIKILDKVNLIWNIASVYIPVKLNHKLLPVNIVNIGSNNKWMINILNNWNIEQLEISLWNIYGNLIEIQQDIPDETIIITNYIDNFDPEKFNLKIKGINE